MPRTFRLLLAALALIGAALVCTPVASQSLAAQSAAAEQVRAASRQYREALRRGDVAAAERFWAPEYTFVNQRGELVTRAQRIENLRTGRTKFDTLGYDPRDEQIRIYGDIAVHRTIVTIAGRYSGREHHGLYRSLIVWVRRNGQWQQLASQLTQVESP